MTEDQAETYKLEDGSLQNELLLIVEKKLLACGACPIKPEPFEVSLDAGGYTDTTLAVHGKFSWLDAGKTTHSRTRTAISQVNKELTNERVGDFRLVPVRLETVRASPSETEFLVQYEVVADNFDAFTSDQLADKVEELEQEDEEVHETVAEAVAKAEEQYAEVEPAEFEPAEQEFEEVEPEAETRQVIEAPEWVEEQEVHNEVLGDAKYQPAVDEVTEDEEPYDPILPEGLKGLKAYGAVNPADIHQLRMHREEAEQDREAEELDQKLEATASALIDKGYLREAAREKLKEQLKRKGLGSALELLRQLAESHPQMEECEEVLDLLIEQGYVEEDQRVKMRGKLTGIDGFSTSLRFLKEALNELKTRDEDAEHNRIEASLND